MSQIDDWWAFAWQNQAKATTLAGIPFVVLALLINIYDSTQYGGSSPGAAASALIILYLILTALVGFASPLLRVGSVGPILAYGVITLLWPLVPRGATYGDITYDSGWPGVVVTIAIASVIIWLFALAGNFANRLMRGPRNDG